MSTPPTRSSHPVTQGRPCVEVVLRCRLKKIPPEAEALERNRLQALLNARMLARSSRRTQLERTDRDPPESSVVRQLQSLEMKLDSLAQKLDALLEQGEDLVAQWLLLSESGIVVRSESGPSSGLAAGDLVHVSFYLPMEWGTRIEALALVDELRAMPQPGWTEISLPFQLISESAQDEIVRAVFQIQLQRPPRPSNAFASQP